MGINIYLASKIVGWNKKRNLSIPSINICLDLSKRVRLGCQESFQEVLKLRRFASSEEWNNHPEEVKIIDSVYREIINQKH